MQFEKQRSLKDFTTFGIGGPARYFITVSTVTQLQDTLKYCSRNQIRFFVLGKGSNVLFDDRGFDGLVILNKISFMDAKNGIVYVGSGYSFSLLGTQTARQGYAGLEFASGIPGTVGGAIYMNAGANGSETFHSLSEVTFAQEDGSLTTYPKEALKWGYRSSSFQAMRGVITAARFQLIASEEARQKQLQIIRYRTHTQPYGDMSAGCVFRNHPSASSGSLIEQCGLKGYTIGGALVSPLHANFIVNQGSASAYDVLKLIDYIKYVVRAQTGHELEMEVRVIPYQD